MNANDKFYEVQQADKRVLIAGNLRACMTLLARASADARTATLHELEDKLHRQAGELGKLLKDVTPGTVLTGVSLDEADKKETFDMLEWAREAPVMTVRSNLPTFSQTAWKAFYERVNALAVAKGLPNGSFYYGLTTAGEFVVAPEYAEEFRRLRGAVTP